MRAPGGVGQSTNLRATGGNCATDLDAAAVEHGQRAGHGQVEERRLRVGRRGKVGRPGAKELGGRADLGVDLQPHRGAPSHF